MPIVPSTYNPPKFFQNYHLSTVYAAMWRSVEVEQERERLELADMDFLDIDWTFSQEPTKKVLLVMHGLEGSAQRPYVRGVAKYFSRRGWDVAAVNFRGCSGEMNRKFRSYHAGATDDLEEVLAHLTKKQKYESIAFNGFSLGGNLMLKYLGGRREKPKELKAAVMISAPCDLYGSLLKLQERRNYVYSFRFLRKLKINLQARAKQFPHKISRKEIAQVDDLLAFDNCYTSRAHGFKDAFDYYKKSSSLQFLPNIKIPTLILNARNDGFLSADCYPEEIAKKNKNLFLEMPAYGGHVAFLQNKEVTYNEERAMQFFNSHLGK